MLTRFPSFPFSAEQLEESKWVRLRAERFGLRISQQNYVLAKMEHQTDEIDEHLRSDRRFLNKLV